MSTQSSNEDSINVEDITQSGLIMEYFQNHPLKNVPHAEIVDWSTAEYLKRTGKVLRDPDRAIRKMHQDGYLVKVENGLYRYDPDLVKLRELEDFTPVMKKQILERDGYKCVQCGRGEKDGVTLNVDHIKPKDKGGLAVLENGQTLCGPHNYQKKNFGQTETGKKMFIRLYELAKKDKNEALLKFTTEILETFEKNGINGHVEWTK